MLSKSKLFIVKNCVWVISFIGINVLLIYVWKYITYWNVLKLFCLIKHNALFFYAIKKERNEKREKKNRKKFLIFSSNICKMIKNKSRIKKCKFWFSKY